MTALQKDKSNPVILQSQGLIVFIHPWIEVSQQRLFMVGKFL